MSRDSTDVPDRLAFWMLELSSPNAAATGSVDLREDALLALPILWMSALVDASDDAGRRGRDIHHQAIGSAGEQPDGPGRLFHSAPFPSDV